MKCDEIFMKCSEKTQTQEVTYMLDDTPTDKVIDVKRKQYRHFRKSRA